MNIEDWKRMIGYPNAEYSFSAHIERGIVCDYPDFKCEYYVQKNGPNSFQRVIMLVPEKRKGKVPAIVVPFYFPEAMMGEEPLSHTPLPFYEGIEMMIHLVRRGFITVSAEAYHLTYIPESTLDRENFQRWTECSSRLRKEHPHWSGIGKLVEDTKLLLNMLCDDKRVDQQRIGIAGHSLGGKVAFYTGCLDKRIKVIVASDFGIRWEQTNWNDEWYWGQKSLDEFSSIGIDHASLLSASGCKPFALIAGRYDNEDSLRLLEKAGYSKDDPRLCFINHATGHRPPQWALNEAYNFLEKQLLQITKESVQ